MQDALYLVFEEAAERLDLLTTITSDADPEAWRIGDVHARLREGQLLRCRAPTRIIDARLFRERTRRFLDWAIAVAVLDAHDDDEDPSVPRPSAADLIESTKAELAHIPAIGDVYGLMMADQISIRQFPCGPGLTELSLAGTLLARPGFLQEEREALFGKYGSAPSVWTMVCQVATLPRVEPEPAVLPTDDQEEEDQSGTKRRLFFEELAIFGMRTFEAQGFVEAPAFPAIHVTQLAVYREVPGGGPRSTKS